VDSTTLAYVAGFLDGDGSIFFQIVKRKDYRRGFQVRSSIAFYQKTEYSWILSKLKRYLKAGYIRYRKTGISDYTIVESKEVKRILLLLQPYVKLKKKQLELGLKILQKLENARSDADFLAACRLVDKFGKLNYSKKRKNTYANLSKIMPP
jgi:lipopolysaccharide export LptBFGC system permease protein LptF